MIEVVKEVQEEVLVVQEEVEEPPMSPKQRIVREISQSELTLNLLQSLVAPGCLKVT